MRSRHHVSRVTTLRQERPAEYPAYGPSSLTSRFPSHWERLSGSSGLSMERCSTTWKALALWVRSSSPSTMQRRVSTQSSCVSRPAGWRGMQHLGRAGCTSLNVPKPRRAGPRLRLHGEQDTSLGEASWGAGSTSSRHRCNGPIDCPCSRWPCLPASCLPANCRRECRCLGPSVSPQHLRRRQQSQTRHDGLRCDLHRSRCFR